MTYVMKRCYFGRLAHALLLMLILLVGKLVHAQPPPVSCSITGSSSVALNSTETFNLTPCTATSWSVTCGTITSSTTTSVTINFNVAACGSAVITANGSTAQPKTVTITWPTLTGGTISAPTHQFINYNSSPAQIDASLPTGGDCFSYTYQWDYSTNGSTYSSVSGGTGQDYQPGALTTTTYYKREAFCASASVYTTNIDTVTVYPQLVSGTITPSTQTINFDRSPSLLTVSGTSGGNSTYSYSWQYCSTSGGTYIPVSGTNSTTFQPGPITSNTWYEVVQTSNGVQVTSAAVEAIVNPQVIPGVITPAFQTITSGTSPDTLTSTEASGGTCSGSFSYQWQSSPNNSTWTNVSGATSLLYEPGTLTSTTYYRVLVKCSTDTEYTGSAEVAVGSTSPSLNFIKLRNILKPGVTDTVTADGLTSPFDVAQTTQYYDNTGALIQAVARQASPLQNDQVTPIVYDNFGRTLVQYLPYTASTNDGNYKPTAFTDQVNFNAAQFPGENYYYSQMTYEASPLNRPLEGFAPGASWVGNNTGVSGQYLINTASDSVQIWSISSAQMSLPADGGTYQPGQLFKEVTTDEQGHQSVVYKDKLGKTILTKIQQSGSPSPGHTGWICTYYVYDTLQNLRVIIQPQAVALIKGSWIINQTIANELCFRYEYDGRRRIAIRKVPGAGQTWAVYDARDRLVMTQDSLLRGQHKWMFAKYDTEDRVDSTGLITDPTYYDSLAHYDTVAYYSTNFPAVSSYTNQLLTQSFYDDYSWVSTYSAPVASSMATNYTSNSSYFITSYNTSPTYAVAITPFVVTRGMPTGSMKWVVGSASQYLYSAGFYDDRGRTIQTQSSNYTSAIDTVTTQYNFDGAVLRSLLNHKKALNTIQNHVVVTKMDYDHRFRLRHVWKNIDNAASDQLIDSLQYNELGQLTAKYLGNQVDSMIYSYNIRGWLTGINLNYIAGTANHYFGMELGYNKTTSVASGNTYLTPELNGSMEGMVWKSAGCGINRKYDFAYDTANRLTSAAFLQNTTGTSWDKTQIDYSVSGISYDANGNLLTMTQRGFKVGGSGPIDSLFYNYLGTDSSNKLMRVADSANNPNSLLEDFHYNTSTKQSTDYNYDGNGNQTHDNNKVIDTISYNYLNLPQLVHIKGEGNVAYTYDAGGRKLQKVITDSLAQLVTTITYVTGFVYQRTAPLSSPGSGTDTLQFIGHEEGRVRWAFQKFTTGSTGYSFQYDFFERDHLGNTRMVLTQERDTTNYIATMEAAYRTTEVQLFGNITNTDTAWTSMPNQSANIPSGLRYAYTNPNDSVSLVDSSSAGGQKTGPSLLLKVMSGDSVNISVQCYYTTPGGGSTNYSSFSDVLTSLSQGLANLTGGSHGTLGNLETPGSTVYSGLTSFLNSDDTVHSGYPKAYINYIFLDDQFNYDSSLSGTVLAASSNDPANVMNKIALGSKLALNRNGYLYIWVSNETSGWDVYYDNLSVQYLQGPVLEENHYYPFGLTMAGISDKAIKTNYAENKYRFNSGTELQNKEFADGSGLEMYDAGFRRLDPQLGRFSQIDPLADGFQFVSPYQYAGDNPIIANDPTGLRYITPSKIGTYNTYLQQYYNSLADPLGHLATEEALAAGGNYGSTAGGGGGGPDENYEGNTSGTSIFSVDDPGDKGSPAAAYLALLNVLGQTPSNTDTYLIQLIFSQTWAGKVANVGATLTPGGMNVTGTTVSSGQQLSNYSLTFSAIDAFISEYSNSDFNQASPGLAETSSIEEKIATVTVLTLDSKNATMDLAGLASKDALKGLKTFTKTTGLIGAAAGGIASGYNIYQSISQGKSVKWNDVAGLTLGIFSAIALATPLGEAIEGLTLAIDVATTATDVYSASQIH